MADHSKFLAAARRVVTQEAEALTILSDQLGDSFGAAVDLLLHAKGRVIVSGMGKSGHIARKIAATFASTGTPAHFVHPADASHGDLGMMTRGDVVLVLSNSGETPELADLVAYTRRFGIPMIGVASKPQSTLLQRADVAIVLPQLGAQLSKVSDLMHVANAFPLVPADTQMSETLLVISQKGFGVVGVTDDSDRLLGIVTDGDLRRHMTGLLDHTASEVMTAQPATVSPDALAEEAVAIMNDKKITCLFVVDPAGTGAAAGFLHIHDCLRAGIV